MSAYLVNTKTMDRALDGLVFAWREIPGSERNALFGFMSDDVKEVDRLGQRLFQMNLDAVNYRYPNDKTKLDFSSYKWKWSVDVSLVQAFKSLQCLLYQCSEGDIPSCKLFEECKKVQDFLARVIVMQLPEYSAAEWG